MNKCPICQSEFEEIDYDFPECFIRRCPTETCFLTWQKLPVGVIINEFSNPDTYRYLKLIVLNMVNQLPINDLYEFYILGKEAYTTEEFTQLLAKYELRKQDAKEKTSNIIRI
jgi:hypothetical protein